MHIAIDICAMLWTVLKCAVVCYREATVVQSETNAELRQRQQALADMKQLHAVGPPPAHPAAPVRCYSIAARGLLSAAPLQPWPWRDSMRPHMACVRVRVHAGCLHAHTLPSGRAPGFGHAHSS